jgi:hypothetical protein
VNANPGLRILASSVLACPRLRVPVSPHDLKKMVSRVGVEPTRPCGHQPLRLVRLPLRHLDSMLKDDCRTRHRLRDIVGMSGTRIYLITLVRVLPR